MPLSPRDRRLRSDHEAMVRLQEESSILRFTTQGVPPDRYLVTFHGSGVAREPGRTDISLRKEHIVLIGLSAAYPRMIPELVWKTPIFHPNISAGGVVCLGGYQTNWVPSLKLDELCLMLWDMIRFANYDVDSPYNREAALWARNYRDRFPVDSRPLRDLTVDRDRVSMTSSMSTTVPQPLAQTNSSSSASQVQTLTSDLGPSSSVGASVAASRGSQSQAAEGLAPSPMTQRLAAGSSVAPVELEEVFFIEAELVQEVKKPGEDILFID